MTYLLGFWVQRAVKSIRDGRDKTPPDGISEDAWQDMIEVPPEQLWPTSVLGRLEQVTFFAALVVGMPAVIAGWLVFKLGSKWQSWQHIMKVPEDIKLDGAAIDPVSYAAARNRWGTNVLQRWLVGTLGNVVVALVGAGIVSLIAQYGPHWVDWLTLEQA